MTIEELLINEGWVNLGDGFWHCQDETPEQPSVKACQKIQNHLNKAKYFLNEAFRANPNGEDNG